MTCKDCIHYEVCERKDGTSTYTVEDPSLNVVKEINFINCFNFKDRSKYVELPDVAEYDIVTKLDEAIDHCYKVATSTDERICVECKAEHMRLCGWLGELKRIKEIEMTLKERGENE